MASDAEQQAAEAETTAAFDAARDAGASGQDVAISRILPDAGRWAACARHVLQLDLGDDPEKASALAYSDFGGGEGDWPVLSGYGTLIADMAQSLNIRLATPVYDIAEDGARVRVQTPAGDLRAKAVVVTVSTNVLSSGAIRFAPGPAADMAQMVTHLPCGAFEKVAYTVTHLPEALGDRQHLTVDPGDGAPAIDFKLMKGAPPMIVSTIAGTPARALMAMPRTGRIAFVRDRLCLALGSDVAKTITGAACTNWLHDPLILGCYSHATPGYGQTRRDMIAADTGRIGFAGEAFSPGHQATAHGAYLSGRHVAARLTGLISA
ncbi:FAD-dependent oxidoreductase [Rhodobacteraceae bacterium KMM 6894]|nr:FAD-dependent oxidoreductase [Rhodobacteraceae bacterium KMM 6894]